MKQMTKKAELFDKAIGDIWTAEQIYEVRPDYAIYHCAQSIEKTLKGIAVCYNKTYDHTHDLNKLLDDVSKIHALDEATFDKVALINKAESSLRYNVRRYDPDAKEALAIIEDTKTVISRFAEWDEVKQHFMEAQQLHNKIVKALKNS